MNICLAASALSPCRPCFESHFHSQSVVYRVPRLRISPALARSIGQANQFRVYVIYGGGPEPLCTSAVELWNLYYVADMELLESSWSGASMEDLSEHRKRLVSLRTLAVAYDAQTRTTPTRCQFFHPSQRTHKYLPKPCCPQAMASTLLQRYPSSGWRPTAQLLVGTK
jgi:hypothetical protein